MLRWRSRSILLIAVALTHLLVSIYRHPAALYDNETSRWLSARAIVEKHTFEIGRRTFANGAFVDTGLMTEEGWGTIDKVYNTKTHVFVSDKQPTLPTVAAAFYWCLTKLGLSFSSDRMLVVRLLVFLLNVPPMLLYFVLLGRLLAAANGSAFAKFYVLVAGLFATFTTTFAATITNHVHGAIATMCCVYLLKQIWEAVAPRPKDLMLLGASLGWLLCNELPALWFVLVVGTLVAVRHPRAAVGFGFPILSLYLAFYAIVGRRAFGDVLPWYGGIGHGQWTVNGYPGSYWDAPIGNDNLAPPYSTYSFHYLIGHHGAFLLSPIFLFSIWALAMGGRWRMAVVCVVSIVVAVMLRAYINIAWKIGLLPPVFASVWALAAPWGWWRHADEATWDNVLRRVTLSTATTVLSFWLIIWRNYGGATVGPRHLIWLTPLWLACMVPVVSRLLRARAGPPVCVAALGVSVFSSVVPGNIPFQDPWTVQLFGYDPELERFTSLFKNGHKGIDVRPAKDWRYRTDVGTKDLVKGEVVSSGREGYLQWGPGIALDAGRYLVEWYGVIESVPPAAILDVDVVAVPAFLARRSIAVVPGSPDPERPFASIEFNLEQPTQNVEYRLFVHKESKIRLSRITVHRL